MDAGLFSREDSMNPCPTVIFGIFAVVFPRVVPDIRLAGYPAGYPAFFDIRSDIRFQLPDIRLEILFKIKNSFDKQNYINI